MNIECVCAVGAQVGEGPLWSPRERAVWFVDIKGRRIHRFEERTTALRSWSTAEDVGFIVHASRGRYVCGFKSGLFAFDPAKDAFNLITPVDADVSRTRLNDAFVDPAGRLWFGTMDDEEVEPTGALYRFDERGLQRCDDGYVITNGPAMSPDGRTLYHVDTMQRTIYAFDAAADGSLSRRRTFACIGQQGAYPDGTAVDAEGCLWVALYGGWGVQRYSPRGELLCTIELPTANCTKPMFGGEDLRTLYVTTACKGLSAEQRAQQPLAGGLFSLRVEAPGLAPNALRYEP